jgi:hypothetical protein
MRESPSQIVWVSAGSIPVDGCVSAAGRCYVCAGEITRGMPVTDWMSTNNTDQNRARSPASTHVCEACCFVHSRIAPVPGRPAKEGKKFGGNFRNYSHLWDERGYLNASKGEKPLIREFLARDHRGPWFAALADSGQKHVLPFAPMNGAGRSGVVLFDEVRVPIPGDQSLVGECASLLTAGATKEEIESGDYSARAWTLCGPALAAFESMHGPHRGGAWFSLAVWLAQRDEAEVAVRQAAEKESSARRKAKGKAAHAHRRASARVESVISGKPRSKYAQTLGPTPGADAGGGSHNGEPRGVGNKDAARPKPPGPKQLGLKGFG